MFRISLNRIHDTVRITEGAEDLTLKVEADPMRMVAGLNAAQERLKTLTEASTADEQQTEALFFAGVIFGKDQAQKMLDFYRGDPACVINVCGQYFSKRLARLISKAQKKA